MRALLPFLTTTTLLGCEDETYISSSLSSSDDERELGDIEPQPTSIINGVDWENVVDLDPTSDEYANAQYVGYLTYIDVEDKDGDGIPEVYIGSCTASLVSPTIVLTNEHCAQDASNHFTSRVNFDYLVDADYDCFFEDNCVDSLRADSYVCNEYVTGSEEEDISLLRCPEDENDGAVVGDDLGGYIELPLSSSVSVVEGDALYVLHHNCEKDDPDEACGWIAADTNDEATKKISYGEVRRVPADDYTISDLGWSFDGENSFVHNADTLPASSAGLVFSQDTHEVIGVHHVGAKFFPIIGILLVGNRARWITSVVTNVADFATEIEDDINEH